MSEMNRSERRAERRRLMEEARAELTAERTQAASEAELIRLDEAKRKHRGRQSFGVTAGLIGLFCGPVGWVAVSLPAFMYAKSQNQARELAEAKGALVARGAVKPVRPRRRDVRAAAAAKAESLAAERTNRPRDDIWTDTD